MLSGQPEGPRPPSSRENPPQIQSGSLPTPKRRSVQILHPFVGSVQQYVEEIADPDRYRPDHCPQCEAHRPQRDIEHIRQLPPATDFRRLFFHRLDRLRQRCPSDRC